jgi:hypothetical protein
VKYRYESHTNITLQETPQSGYLAAVFVSRMQDWARFTGAQATITDMHLVSDPTPLAASSQAHTSWQILASELKTAADVLMAMHDRAAQMAVGPTISVGVLEKQTGADAAQLDFTLTHNTLDGPLVWQGIFDGFMRTLAGQTQEMFRVKSLPMPVKPAHQAQWMLHLQADNPKQIKTANEQLWALMRQWRTQGIEVNVEKRQPLPFDLYSLQQVQQLRETAFVAAA